MRVSKNGALKKIRTRFVSFISALVLATTSLSGIAPLLVGQKVAALSSGVVINEILSNPSSGNSEWVELYNTTASSVDISKWTIKSGSSTFAKLSDSQSINGHSYYVTAATTGTTLSNSGNTLHLRPATGSTDEDTVAFPALGTDESYGHSPDGTGALTKFTAAQTTKNAANYVASTVPACSADATTFDTDTLGSVNGQNGWKSTGSYDQAIVSNTYGISSFGCKSLRLSNAATSGSFGDQTFSYSAANEAGETSATNGGQSGGTRQNYYEAQFDIASTQSAQQSGLSLSVSPDRGDGSRMSYLRFEDQADGIHAFFDDVQGSSNPANFVESDIATLSRTAPHTIKFAIDYKDGASNDIVNVYIDGSLVHTGTSWENYYRYDSESSAEQSPRTSDSLIFRAGGTAVPATSGKGFLFDNVSVATSTVVHDTTAPVVTVTPVAGSLLHGSVTFDITVTDDNLDPHTPKTWVYLYNNVTGQSKGASVDLSSGHGTFTVDTTGLADGTYTLDVGRLADAFGNYSGVTDSYFHNYVIDNGAPTGLANVSPSDNTFTTTAHQTSIDWTDASDAHGPVTYYYEASNSNATNANGSFASPVYQSGALTNSQIATPNTPEGTYYWHVRAADSLGNATAWTSPWKITVDNTAPSASLAFPTPGLLAKSFTVTFNEAVNPNEAADPANYLLNNWPGTSSFFGLTGHATVGYDAASHIAVVTFTDPGWYVSAEQQWGVKNIHDLAGNEIDPNPTTAFSTALADPTAPGTPTTTNPTNDHTIVWTWAAATDPGDADASGVKGYEYALTALADAPTTWTFTASITATTVAPADGNYILHIRAVDNAGNTGPEAEGSVLVDSVKPKVNLTFPVEGQFLHKNFTITGTAKDNQTGIDQVKVFVAKLNADGSFNSYVIKNRTATYDAGNHTFTYDARHLPDGPYAIHVVAFDAAGNHRANQTVNITVDNTKPTLAITSPSDGDTLSNLAPFTITGAASDNGSGLLNNKVTVRLKDASGVLFHHKVTVAADGSWSLDIPAGTITTDEQVQIVVIARDNLGNHTRITQNLTIDNTAPAVTINDYSGTDTTPTLTGTVDDPTANVTVSIDGGAAQAATNNGDGTWTLTLASPLTIGNHTAVANATDTYGNSSTDTADLAIVAPAKTNKHDTADTTNVQAASDGFTPQALDAGTTTPTTGHVLGDKTSDSNNSKSPDTKKLAPAADKVASLFGIAWYWWILIVLAVIAALAAAYRRANTDDKTPSNTK